MGFGEPKNYIIARILGQTFTFIRSYLSNSVIFWHNGPMAQNLLIATQNKGKLHEIQTLLIGLDFDLVTPDQIGLNLDVVEDGQTYRENAAKKAREFAAASGLLTLADDSGLEVKALNGEPGLYSARYSAKPGATDADRRDFLLDQLKPHGQPWPAQFRCIVALMDPTGNLHFTEGICPGEIIPDERGKNGFGYDPIFLVTALGKTMAELSTVEKNRLSHRARAIAKTRLILAQFTA
jgi:XTP/dITP diphosphohydrolase